MKVLFTTSGWAGHYFCMVPLGWAFQAAGHDVRVLCTPAHSPAISRAGLVPVPILESLDMMYVARLMLYDEVVSGRTRLPNPPLHPVTAQPVADLSEFDVDAAEAEFAPAYRESARAAFEATLRYARAFKPDLVCHDVMSEEGAVAARELGVPAVYCAPGLFGTADEELGLNLSLRDVVTSGARPGFAPWSRDQITHMVDPSPASAVPPHGASERLPIRYVPYNGPGELPEWAWRRHGARRRVCVLWGRSATGIYGTQVPALRAAIDAVLDQDAEVALAASGEQIAALGRLPVGVRVLQDFPLQLALARSDALVHHGSDNCLMNGAVAGIPQIALSLSSDQLAFGARMAGTGAVIAHDGLRVTPEQVHTAVADVLNVGGYRESAARLRQEMLDNPAPSEVARNLLALAGDLVAAG